MSIKRRMWALSSITATETVDYALMDASKALALDIAAVTSAVTEGDKARLDQVNQQADKVNQQADKVRADLDGLGRIAGQQDTGTRLKQQFNDYHAPALASARIMLEMDGGDPQAAIGKMQAALALLNADLARTADAAQRQFAAGISTSKDSVRNALVVMVASASIVIAVPALVSWFTVRTIWQQLGGDPAYAREIVQAVASGDLSMEIRPETGDQAGATMTQIVDAVRQVQTIMLEIRDAGARQHAGIEDIGHAIGSIDEMTQQNAALVEEASAAAESLTGQTVQLTEALAVFKVEHATAQRDISAPQRFAIARSIGQ